MTSAAIIPATVANTLSAEGVKADILAATGMIARLCRTPDVRTIVIAGDPLSKARARFNSKGQVYTPKRTIEGEKRYVAAMHGLPIFKGNVAVACIFHRATRQRVDVDNLLKAVLDAGTAARIWDDDSQVTALIGLVGHDPLHPRAVVCFGDHDSSMTRGEDAMIACATCGKLFMPVGTRRRQIARFCSQACRRLDPITCGICGRAFKPDKVAQKYCSPECRYAAKRVPRPCAQCGGRRAKSSSTLCRECFLAGARQQPLSLSTSGQPNREERTP